MIKKILNAIPVRKPVDTTMNNSICPLAWNHISVTTTGYYRLCCVSKNDPLKHHVNEVTPMEWINSEHMKSIRDQMRRGEAVKYCEKCQIEESIGHTSKRLGELEKWPEAFNQNVNIEYLDLRLGNSCNLKCRMCWPGSSNKILEEVRELQSAGHSTPYDLIPLDSIERLSKWPDNENFWQSLDDILPNIKEIYLTGGEPAMIRNNILLLEKLIELDLAKNIFLRMNSNVTLFNHKWHKILPKFKHVNISASIDGIGRVNDYIRYPSSWDEIDQNICYLDSIDNVDLTINTTVQVYNILYLHELFDYALEHDIKLYTTMLIDPDYFNIRNLPDEPKIAAQDYLDELIKSKKYSDTYLRRQAEKILDFLNQLPQTDIRDGLWEYTNLLDQKRGQDIQDFLPKLCKEWHHR